MGKDGNPREIVFFDLETSGLEPPPSEFFQGRYAAAKGKPWSWLSTPHHEIIQLAAVAVDAESWEVIDRFERKIAFEVGRASPEALEINSYDPEVWEREAVPARQAMAKFRDFLRNHSTVQKISKTGNPYKVAKLAGHNVARFDLPFLTRAYKALGLGFFPGDFIPLDTLQLAAWWLDSSRERGLKPGDLPENLKLETLADYLNIPTDGAHDALADVEMNVLVAADLFVEVTGYNP